MKTYWSLSKKLCIEILYDHISDNFVCQLIWERLGYILKEGGCSLYYASPTTPAYWVEKYQQAPQVIARRDASVHLTRSIPKKYKQSLKECLDFEGYSINELFPRRTRRATAVNWLLSWGLIRGEKLPESGNLPTLLKKPLNPLAGHPGDPLIE
ncbi:DUF1823 family protein [Prochlorococcus marinus]|uniref:DUF1823 family protein n=1 Tax=Prochlorococcus marinus TaxID=1219 RepID=UPI0022B50BA5|nr:DUF1823 family protein [Prochlorococcus marinus]